MQNMRPTSKTLLKFDISHWIDL